MRINIGSRKSDLARLQAYRVGEAIQKKLGSDSVEIIFHFKESLGDKNLTDPLWKMPEKGVFTEDFYQDLLTGQVDMVVHSWKDLPTEGKPETEIYATLPRADQRDLLLVKKNHLNKVQQQGRIKIFSSSPRRFYNLEPFLKKAIPALNASMDIHFENVRGNIPTRVRKLLESDDIDGLVLAKAAVDRLLQAAELEFTSVQEFLRQALQQMHWMVLPLSENPTAAAQGALAIEILKTRTDLKSVLDLINDSSTQKDVLQERKILGQYGGGCHQKIGVSLFKNQFLFLKGLTDQGQVLNQTQSLLPSATIKLSESELISSQSFQFFKRQEIANDFTGAGKNILVTRYEKSILPYLREANLVWAAGVETWLQLAAQGIWVSGCLDNLGDPIGVDTLISNVGHSTWYKLSHSQALEISKNLIPESSDSTNKYIQVAYYELVPSQSLDSLRAQMQALLVGKKMIYWRSGSQFLMALQLGLNVSDFYHACGPGLTAQILSKYSLPYIFYSEQDWRQQCQK